MSFPANSPPALQVHSVEISRTFTVQYSLWLSDYICVRFLDFSIRSQFRIPSVWLLQTKSQLLKCQRKKGRSMQGSMVKVREKNSRGCLQTFYYNLMACVSFRCAIPVMSFQFLNLCVTLISLLQVLTTNMWLNLNWMDTQLTWNDVSKRIV